MVGIALKFCMGDINFRKIEKEKKNVLHRQTSNALSICVTPLYRGC